MINSKYPVIIIGAGHAGLSLSAYLSKLDVKHLILEKHEVAYSWKHERWDSFCLVTPNWQCNLPNYQYTGDDPKGFMVKNDIVDFVQQYAKQINAPVKTNVEVTQIVQVESGDFEVTCAQGESYLAQQIVLATGGYHDPIILPVSKEFPAEVYQIHSKDYRNAQQLPEGDVLVVGSGQSGCQIAEDLLFEGRNVHLAVGNAPRAPRVYRGRDAVEWLDLMGHYDLPIDKHPLGEKVREKSNHYLTGRDGGREIDLRVHATHGMQLYGRLNKIVGDQIVFHDDLIQNLDAADATYNRIRAMIDTYIKENNIEAAQEPKYKPVWSPSPEYAQRTLKTSQIKSIIWSTGFRTNYDYVKLPIFDNKHPTHTRGITSIPGIYFLGLPWLYTWGSGRMSGIAKDAEYISQRIKKLWDNL